MYIDVYFIISFFHQLHLKMRFESKELIKKQWDWEKKPEDKRQNDFLRKIFNLSESSITRNQLFYEYKQKYDLWECFDKDNIDPGEMVGETSKKQPGFMLVMEPQDQYFMRADGLHNHWNVWYYWPNWYLL